jgi:hypothetical protein
MKNKIWAKIFILVLFIPCLLIPSPSHAFYKKKALVGQFQDPAGWNKPYHPGNIIEKLLVQELTRKNRVQLISISGNMRGSMDNHDISPDKNSMESAIFDSWKMDFPGIVSIQGPSPKMGKPMQKMDRMDEHMDMGPPWPVEMGRRVPQKAALTEIRGKVIKFLPDMKKENSAESASLGSLTRENAELQVHVELVQNKTGRILFEKKFKLYSSKGTRPFSIENLNPENKSGKSDPSSMSFILDKLITEMGLFIGEKLNSLMLEGEIIGINLKEITPQIGNKAEFEEEILVNIGSENGVRIGDKFKVHAVGLGLHDPITGSDLGDIYVRTGVIQILHAWEGFSRARSVGGKNFKTGFLVQSLSNGKFPSREKVPWWEFHGIRAVDGQE